MNKIGRRREVGESRKQSYKEDIKSSYRSFDKYECTDRRHRDEKRKERSYGKNKERERDERKKRYGHHTWQDPLGQLGPTQLPELKNPVGHVVPPEPSNDVDRDVVLAACLSRIDVSKELTDPRTYDNCQKILIKNKHNNEDDKVKTFFFFFFFTWGGEIELYIFIVKSYVKLSLIMSTITRNSNLSVSICFSLY